MKKIDSINYSETGEKFLRRLAEHVEYILAKEYSSPYFNTLWYETLKSIDCIIDNYKQSLITENEAAREILHYAHGLI